jgi:hypothetical protein
MAVNVLRHRVLLRSSLFDSTVADASPIPPDREFEFSNNLTGEFQTELVLPASGDFVTLPSDTATIDKINDLLFVVRIGDHIEMEMLVTGDVSVGVFRFNRISASSNGLFLMSGCTAFGSSNLDLKKVRFKTVNSVASSLPIYRLGKV